MDSIFTCVGGIVDGQYIYLCRGQGSTFKGRDRAAPLDAPLKIKKES